MRPHTHAQAVPDRFRLRPAVQGLGSAVQVADYAASKLAHKDCVRDKVQQLMLHTQKRELLGVDGHADLVVYIVCRPRGLAGMNIRLKSAPDHATVRVGADRRLTRVTLMRPVPMPRHAVYHRLAGMFAADDEAVGFGAGQDEAIEDHAAGGELYPVSHMTVTWGSVAVCSPPETGHHAAPEHGRIGSRADV